MIRVKAVFGGESSGHYFYQFPYGTFEAPTVFVLKFLQYVSAQNKPTSQIIKPYQIYFHSGEINSEVADVNAKIEQVAKKYSDANVNRLDGVTIEYSDWWFNVRGFQHRTQNSTQSRGQNQATYRNKTRRSLSSNQVLVPMASLKPYIVIPNLIEQPTWGGHYYIVSLKKLRYQEVALKTIGQSYELYEETNFSQKTSTEYQPSVEMSGPSDGTSTNLIAFKDSPLSIKELIAADPKAVLGPKVLETLPCPKMQVLVKLTQAKENSYQIHIKHSQPGVTWQSKPESWYYLEPGLITSGAKPNVDRTKYQTTCEAIDELAKNISEQIKSGQISLESGRKQLSEFISLNHPRQFVNTVTVGRDDAIDLSECGVHHSWESDEARFPHGNIVYEVQKNVYDPVSTIRAFDQGKIKSDGSIRPIQVNDYFKYVDRTPKANQPQSHLTLKKALKKSSTQTIRQIFATPNYSLQEFTFTDTMTNQFTRLTDSFHHLFVREGNIRIVIGESFWTVTQGYSIFIPAGIKAYTLKPYKSKYTKVLKTYV